MSRKERVELLAEQHLPSSKAVTDAEVLEHIRAACRTARPERFTDRDHCCECAEHDDLLAARDLDSLRIDDVGNMGWDPICFTTDEAFYYYFPALARLALDEPTPEWGWYFYNLLFHLTYEGGNNRRLAAATPAQREAVFRLVCHMRDTRAELLKDHTCEPEFEQAFEIWSDRR